MTRTLFCLLVSFGLGALAFSGESEEAGSLRGRVRALTLELRQRADARPRPAGLTERLYDLSDLLLPIAAEPLPRDLDLRAERSSTEGLEEELRDEPLFYRAAILDFLVNSDGIDWERWEGVRGAELSLRGNALFARTPPRVHERIERALALLRRSANRRLQIDVTAVRVAEEERAAVAASLLALDDALAERLEADGVLGRLRIRCREGRRVSRRVGRVVSYLFDYGAEIAQEATIGDPKAAGVLEGCHATLRAFLDDGGGGVRLELRLDRNELARPMRRLPTEHGPVELPRLSLTRVRTAFWAPLGRTVVAGGSMECLYLVRIERVGP